MFINLAVIMSTKTERVFFMFVNPGIAVVIIILNSVAIYKMLKSTKQTAKITANRKITKVSLPGTNIFLLAFGDIIRSNLKQNEKSKGQVKNGNKEIKQTIPMPKTQISKCIVLLLNLAISDVVVGSAIVFHVLLLLINTQVNSKTLLFIMQFLISCLLPISLLVSMANLQLVAILKFYAIRRPLKYRAVTKSFLVKVCILKWILITLSVALDYTFSYTIHKKTHSQLYQVVIPHLILTAAVTLAVTYFLIFKSIRSRTAVGESCYRYRNKQSKKAFKTCLYTVIAFAIFSLPNMGWRIYEMFTDSHNQPIGKVLSYFVLFNSVVNPIIYFAVFRK